MQCVFYSLTLCLCLSIFLYAERYVIPAAMATVMRAACAIHLTACLLTRILDRDQRSGTDHHPALPHRQQRADELDDPHGIWGWRTDRGVEGNTGTSLSLVHSVELPWHRSPRLWTSASFLRQPAHSSHTSSISKVRARSRCSVPSSSGTEGFPLPTDKHVLSEDEKKTQE